MLEPDGLDGFAPLAGGLVASSDQDGWVPSAAAAAGGGGYSDVPQRQLRHSGDIALGLALQPTSGGGDASFLRGQQQDNSVLRLPSAQRLQQQQLPEPFASGSPPAEGVPLTPAGLVPLPARRISAAAADVPQPLQHPQPQQFHEQQRQQQYIAGGHAGQQHLQQDPAAHHQHQHPGRQQEQQPQAPQASQPQLALSGAQQQQQQRQVQLHNPRQQRITMAQLQQMLPGKHMLMQGAPGTGKTISLRRLAAFERSQLQLLLVLITTVRAKVAVNVGFGAMALCRAFDQAADWPGAERAVTGDASLRMASVQRGFISTRSRRSRAA